MLSRRSVMAISGKTTSSNRSLKRELYRYTLNKLIGTFLNTSFPFRKSGCKVTRERQLNSIKQKIPARRTAYTGIF